MSILNEVQGHGHETVSIFQNQRKGYLAIVAVHSTAIGPSLGGCRMREYGTLDDALADVLNLSEAMSYKNALCGINFGGGKSVIVGDSERVAGRAELFEWFGRCVQSLGGRYITAEDMGTSVSDMSLISKQTSYVAGRDPKSGGGGDPSPFTAIGVFEGMRACLERVFGSGDVRGRSVAIQGVGHVGMYLIKLLAEAGAKLTICDPVAAHLEAAVKLTGATVVDLSLITQTACDVFSPCAVGGTINAVTVPQLQCKIVAGAANNQLASESLEGDLQQRGILYAPDFAINAGGVILCADEFEPGGFYASRVHDRVNWIYRTVGMVLDQSKVSGETTGEVARRLARERIQNAAELKERQSVPTADANSSRRGRES